MKHRWIVVTALAVLMLTSPLDAGAQTGQSLSTKEEQFLDDLFAEVETMGELTQDLGQIFDDLSSNPRLAMDATWTRRTFRTLREFHELANNAWDLDPSPRQQHLLVLWVETTMLLSEAAADFEIGIDLIDSASIDRGTSLIAEATDVTDELTEAITEFQDSPDKVARQARRIDGPVEDCSDFRDYNVAQVFFALHPEERRVLDRNRDGRACEREFDRAA